jgi:hypothetical protein
LESGLLWHLISSFLFLTAFIFFVKEKQKNLDIKDFWKPVLKAINGLQPVNRSLIVRACKTCEAMIASFEHVRGCQIVCNSLTFDSIQPLEQLLKIALLSENEFILKYPNCKDKKIKIVYETHNWSVYDTE